MVSTVTRRNPNGTITKTTFREGKPVSSITTQRSTGRVKSISPNYREERIKELEEKGIDRAIASQISLVESKGQTFAQITPEIARQVKRAGVTSSSINKRDVANLSQDRFKPKNSSEGKVQGKYYKNLTRQELINNRLNPRTRAVLDYSRTRLIQGKGTSRDLFNVLSRNKKELDIINTRNVAIQLINIGNKLRSQGIGTVQGKVYAQLTQQEILNNSLNPNSKAIFLSPNTEERRKLVTVANSYKNIIEGKGTSRDIFNITSKGNKLVDLTKTSKQAKNLAEFSKFKKQSNLRQVIAESPKEQQETIKNIFTGFGGAGLNYVKSLGKGGLKLISDTSKPNSKTFLDAPIFKSYWKTKLGQYHKSLIDKLRKAGTPTTSLRVNDPDVKNLLILTGFLLIPESKLLNLGFKGAGALGLGYTGAKATSNLLNKKYSSSGEALFETSLYALMFLGAGKKTKNVKVIPKKANAKLGTIFKDPKGNYGVVTKGGRVYRVPKSKVSKFIKAEQKGATLRKAKTEIARLEKKVLTTKPLTKAERNLLLEARNIRSIKKLSAEASKLARKLKLKGADKVELTKLYIRYQTKPTKVNINNLKTFAEEQKITQLVNVLNKRILKNNQIKPTRITKFDRQILKLDSKIANNLFKDKYGISKTKLNSILSKARAEARRYKAKTKEIKQIEELAFNVAIKKKGANKKLNSFLKRLQDKSIKQDVKLSFSKLDKQAQKKGFKDNKELQLYEQAFNRYKKGDAKAERILKSIEKKLIQRKNKLSLKKAKESINTRNRLIKEAIVSLESGNLKIKNKGFKILKTRSKMSKLEANALLLSVNARLDLLNKKKQIKEDAIARFKAKKSLLEISKGKVVEFNDPNVLRQVKILLNKGELAKLRQLKAIKIEKGLIKGKLPRTKLTKAQRKSIILKAKEKVRLDRIARKRDKFKLAGLKKERKIRRKQYLDKLKEENIIINKILSGDELTGFTIEASESGILLKPAKNIKKTKVNYAKDIIKKKNIPKDSVSVSNKDGTIQLLKTEKVTKNIQKSIKQAPKQKKLELKQEIRQLTNLKQELIKKTVRKLKLKQKIKLKQKLKTPILINKLKQDLILSVGSITKQLQKQGLNIKQLQKQGLDSKQAQSLKQIQKSILDQSLKFNKLIDSINLTKSKQILDLKKDIKEILLLEPANLLKIRKKLKEVKINEVKNIFPKIKLTWDNKPPKNYNYLVNVRVRVKGKVKTIPLKTTPNEALNYIIKLVDNTTSRSFDLIIVGISKTKDIKKPSLKKFRFKRSRGSKVLKFVEKSKYAIDTRGEKRGLRLKLKK